MARSCTCSRHLECLGQEQLQLDGSKLVAIVELLIWWFETVLARDIYKSILCVLYVWLHVLYIHWRIKSDTYDMLAILPVQAHM